MSGPESPARPGADPRTVRLALELLERTAGRRDDAAAAGDHR